MRLMLINALKPIKRSEMYSTSRVVVGYRVCPTLVNMDAFSQAYRWAVIIEYPGDISRPASHHEAVCIAFSQGQSYHSYIITPEEYERVFNRPASELQPRELKEELKKCEKGNDE